MTTLIMRVAPLVLAEWGDLIGGCQILFGFRPDFWYYWKSTVALGRRRERSCVLQLVRCFSTNYTSLVTEGSIISLLHGVWLIPDFVETLSEDHVVSGGCEDSTACRLFFAGHRNFVKLGSRSRKRSCTHPT